MFPIPPSFTIVPSLSFKHLTHCQIFINHQQCVQFSAREHKQSFATHFIKWHPYKVICAVHQDKQMRPPAARGPILKLHILLSSPKGQSWDLSKTIATHQPGGSTNVQRFSMSPQAIWEFAVSLGMCDTQNGIEQLSAHFSKCHTAASSEDCSNLGLGNNSVVKGTGRLPPGVVPAQKHQAWI